MTYHIGIDPGQTGAIAAVHGDHAGAIMMPYSNGKISVPQIEAFFEQFPPVSVCIEKSQSFPRQGVASSFNYGRDYGFLLGMLTTMAYQFEEVAPVRWQNRILKDRPDATGDRKADRKAGKQFGIRYVADRFPTLDMAPGARRKPQDGIADAICIALYAELIYFPS